MNIYKYKYNKESNLVPNSKHHSRSNFKVGLTHSTLITVLTLLLETYFRCPLIQLQAYFTYSLNLKTNVPNLFKGKVNSF